MKRMTNLAALAGLVMASISAHAEDITGSGTVTYAGFHIGQRPIADGKGLGQDHLKGVILANDPSNPLHLAAQDCIGASIIDKKGNPGDGAGYCDGIDKDGDVFLIWYRNKGNDRTWSFMGGTGKFDGITGGGTTTPMVGEPADRVVVKWEGKWTMK